MRKTFIAIAAVIITSASIFLACSKDSETEEVKNSTSNIKEKCTEFQEQLGEDATIIGFASFDNPEEIFYTFNFDELVEKTSFLCQQEFGFDVILEDFKILSNEPLNPDFEKSEYQVSIFVPETNSGATLWFYVEKFINPHNGIIIYYNVADGGGIQPNFICEQGTCKGTCSRNATYDDKGNMTSACCCCSSNKLGEHCDQVFAGNNNGTKTSLWNTIIGKIGDCIVALIGKINSNSNTNS